MPAPIVCLRPARRRSRGVSLVELAIGLLILSLIIGGLLVPLASQVEQSRVSQTQRQLEEIREALIGFALANGRLPCPASPLSNGLESQNPAGSGICTNPWDGFVPAVTLGLSQVDAQGYSVDAWGLAQNRVRYAVTTSNTNAFTRAGQMRATGMAALAPDLHVCASGTGIVGGGGNLCGAAGNTLSQNAVAVIYSVGANAATTTGGMSLDEAQNPNPNPNNTNNDRAFVSRVRSVPGAAAAEFDDLVTWLSPNVLYSRMVMAGQLP
jgi:type II secretory pathway pseudopilin PulG